MNEKRFQQILDKSRSITGHYAIYDSKTLIKYKVPSKQTSKDLVNLLNEMNDELGKLSILYKAKCKTEEQLLEMSKEVEKENEQLKSEIELLKKQF